MCNDMPHYARELLIVPSNIEHSHALGDCTSTRDSIKLVTCAIMISRWYCPGLV